ncbi:MAG: TIGR03435 family protein [Acidobacteriia bacterium]|nr:TIGR03435 family protein [Terriglobia bacterium]
MSAIQFLSSPPWVEHLGWMLLHFLWQGVLIAAVYAATRKWIARSAGPNVRYVLACAALAGMAAAPVITWSLMNPTAAVSIAVSVPHVANTPTSAPAVATPALLSSVPRALPEPLLPWVVAIWFAGALVFWFRLLSGWIRAVRLRSRLVRRAPPEWQQALDRLKTRIRVSRPVRLLVSSLVQAPAVVGWIRPVVLVPVGALTGLPPEQIEALLLHELAHIRRHDYLVNVLQSVVETLLFYHPAVWWVSSHLRTERELCCDDVAVSVSGDVLTYARALAELESSRRIHFGAAMAATGGSLAHRIARLLGQPRPASRTLSGPGVIAAAMLLAITAFTVFGQPVARPKFEVASIKPSQEPGPMTVRPLPGRLTANATVKLLMQNAYTVHLFQILGGPDWINSERYEIEAKAAGNISRDQMFLMLESLLADRFQLKIHRETRDLPVYTLVAARSGLKLPPPKDGGCVSLVPDGTVPPEVVRGRMTPPGPGQPPLSPCGGFRTRLENTGARMRGGQITMPEFARELSIVLARTVIDKTGFTGLFDLQLDFLPDETTPALPAPPPGAPLDSSSPSILTAIQEQLGLRLESAKGPVEVIIVDHIERPSAN